MLGEATTKDEAIMILDKIKESTIKSLFLRGMKSESLGISPSSEIFNSTTASFFHPADYSKNIRHDKPVVSSTSF